MSSSISGIIGGQASKRLSPEISNATTNALLRNQIKKTKANIVQAIKENKTFIVEPHLNLFTFALLFLGVILLVGLLLVGLFFILLPFYSKDDLGITKKILLIILGVLTGLVISGTALRILSQTFQVLTTKVFFNRHKLKIVKRETQREYSYEEIQGFGKDFINLDAFILRFKDGTNLVLYPFLHRNFILLLGYIAAKRPDLKPVIKSYLTLRRDKNIKDFWGKVIYIVRKEDSEDTKQSASSS